MAVSLKDLFIASMLSYLEFENKHKGRNILEILSENSIKFENNCNIKILRPGNIIFTQDFFRESLQKMSISEIENRRAESKKIFNKNLKTGYYSVTLKKNDDIIISFRGSETFPFEEAYKDFVETNFTLGIGKRPKQFSDVADVIDETIKKNKGRLDNIYITGHSLGGGLAQFAVLYIHKKYGIIPNTVTWNAVGVNRSGVIQIKDFIKVDALLESKLQCSPKMVTLLKPFRDGYLKLLEEYNPLKYPNVTLLNALGKNDHLRLVIADSVKKIFLNNEARDIFQKKLIDFFFCDEELISEIKKGKAFIQKISENTIYSDRVKNYIHSKDLTSYVFKHVGEQVQMDAQERVTKQKIKDSSIVKTIISLKKTVLNYHFEDVFVPYFSEISDEEFSNEIRNQYITSCLRRIIYSEKGFSSDLLGEYYTTDLEWSLGFDTVKKLLLEGIQKNETDFMYKNVLMDKISNSKEEELKQIWIATKKRMSSPYSKQDIFDVLNY